VSEIYISYLSLLSNTTQLYNSNFDLIKYLSHRVFQLIEFFVNLVILEVYYKFIESFLILIESVFDTFSLNWR
jgi:hypothetical protein